MGVRIGHGYDVHTLVENRRLIIGGVDIPYNNVGLLGHSDADVLTHAVMDALLGALGHGDIGRMFPDSDPAYKDADSIKLLARCAGKMREDGYRLGNLDATVVAQAPRMSPHIRAMRTNLARALGADEADVNVKATTEEGLGFTGAGQGIAAHCVLTVQRL